LICQQPESSNIGPQVKDGINLENANCQAHGLVYSIIAWLYDKSNLTKFFFARG
jgi:hypothetical protein